MLEIIAKAGAGERESPSARRAEDICRPDQDQGKGEVYFDVDAAYSEQSEARHIAPLGAMP